MIHVIPLENYFALINLTLSVQSARVVPALENNGLTLACQGKSCSSKSLMTLNKKANPLPDWP
jgi:hypothetical protein